VNAHFRRKIVKYLGGAADFADSRSERRECFSLVSEGGGTPLSEERIRLVNAPINRPVKMPFRPDSFRYTEDAMPEQDVEGNLAEAKQSESRGLAVGLTSLFFILLQSACTAFMAISGLRLLIGVGALAAATTGLKFMGALHAAPFRIPMEIVAIAGSVVNLFAVRRIRRLRSRPASQWRMKPATAKQLRSESWQVGLAILTLLLVAVEWGFHIYLHGAI
jgi:hypothetical protein